MKWSIPVKYFKKKTTNNQSNFYNIIMRLQEYTKGSISYYIALLKRKTKHQRSHT